LDKLSYLTNFLTLRKGMSINLQFADNGGGGSPDADVRTFLQKTQDFSKIMVFPQNQRGGLLRQYEHFSDKGRMAQFLWTFPKAENSPNKI